MNTLDLTEYKAFKILFKVYLKHLKVVNFLYDAEIQINVIDKFLDELSDVVYDFFDIPEANDLFFNLSNVYEGLTLENITEKDYKRVYETFKKWQKDPSWKNSKTEEEEKDPYYILKKDKTIKWDKFIQTYASLEEFVFAVAREVKKRDQLLFVFVLLEKSPIKSNTHIASTLEALVLNCLCEDAFNLPTPKETAKRFMMTKREVLNALKEIEQAFIKKEKSL